MHISSASNNLPEARVPQHYQYVKRTTSESVKAIFLILGTLGIWRLVKNYQLEKALKAGKIEAATEAIKSGATHRIPMKKFEELMNNGQCDAALFMGTQMVYEDFEPRLFGKNISEVFNKSIELICTMTVEANDDKAKTKFRSLAASVNEYQRLYEEKISTLDSGRYCRRDNPTYGNKVYELFCIAVATKNAEKVRIWGDLVVRVDTVGGPRDDTPILTITPDYSFKYPGDDQPRLGWNWSNENRRWLAEAGGGTLK